MSLKQKTATGLFWVFLEKIGLYFIDFAIIIILARLLSPEDFGLVAMVMIFFSVSTTIMEGGLNQALIREKKPNEEDVNTVFTTNLVFAIVLYIILYLLAPYIALFFENKMLTPIVRIMGLSLIFRSFGMAHRSMVVQSLNFKKEFYLVLPAHLFTGLLAIYLAYKGAGVYALVIKYTALAFFTSLIFIIFSKYPIRLGFSKESFNRFFSFGLNIMLSRLISSIYLNLYRVFIAKFYSAAALGYYKQANNLRKMGSSNIVSAIQKVTYPVLAKLQDNPEKLKNAYRRVIKTTSVIVIPIMVFLFITADVLIPFLLGDQWMLAVPMLKIIVVGGMVFNISLINQNLLKVLGKTRLYLRLEILKKISTTAALLIGIWFDILILLAILQITAFINAIIYSYVSSRYIDYRKKEQITDFFSALSYSIPMIIILAGFKFWFTTHYNQPFLFLLFAFILGVMAYSATVYRYYKKDIKELISLVKQNKRINEPA